MVKIKAQNGEVIVTETVESNPQILKQFRERISNLAEDFNVETRIVRHGLKVERNCGSEMFANLIGEFEGTCNKIEAFVKELEKEASENKKEEFRWDELLKILEKEEKEEQDPVLCICPMRTGMLRAFLPFENFKRFVKDEARKNTIVDKDEDLFG